jgi:molybdopterin biosynthesis enzyme MoaB
LSIVADRHIDGIGELFRNESSQHTPMAWLSRANAVLIGHTLVIALPGSSKAVAQGMDILAPVLAHALSMVAGGGHA